MFDNGFSKTACAAILIRLTVVGSRGIGSRRLFNVTDDGDEGLFELVSLLSLDVEAVSSLRSSWWNGGKRKALVGEDLMLKNIKIPGTRKLVSPGFCLP